MTLDNIYTSAERIVRTVVRQDVPADAMCLINENNCARAANKFRQSRRAAEPKTLDFDLEEHHLPQGFLQKDIVSVEGARHLIFATAQQLQLLRAVEHVYMDGTFKVVKKPFTQLFGIHGFLKDDDGNCVKQVPLAFALMSRMEKLDYVAVFKAFKELAPNLANVDMTTDFEAAIWRAARKVFPGMTVHGCSFHWGQAVWRKIQTMGVVVDYKNRPESRQYMKMLFALPYLPANEIQGALDRHESTAPDRLKPLVKYIQDNWMGAKRWKPEDWCVYKRAIRTNNDAEGWHHRLNNNAGRPNLNVYLLAQLLHDEARFIPYQLRLVSDRQIRRHQRKQTKKTEGNLAQLWRDFERGNLTSMQLLKRATQLSVPLCPVPRAARADDTTEAN